MKRSVLSAHFERKRFIAANFLSRLYISLTDLGGCKYDIALTFEGSGLIPCFVMRCPENLPSSTPKENFFGLNFRLITQSLSRVSLISLFTTIFSSTSTQLRISSLSACRASLAILCSFFCLCGLFSERRVPIPFGVWNFIALWIVDTTIPICCMAVLPSSRLCGESDLTMTKLSVFMTVRRPSPIVISKGTSPKGQDYSPKKPMSEVFESTRRDLIDEMAVFGLVSGPLTSGKPWRVWARTHRHIWLCVHGLHMEEVVIRSDSYRIRGPVVQRSRVSMSGYKSKASKLESMKKMKQAILREGSNTNKEKEVETNDYDDSNMDLSHDVPKGDDDVSLLNETHVYELMDITSHPVHTDANTTSMVNNPEENHETISYKSGASEVPFGIHVDVQATNLVLQDMFPDEAAHHNSIPPANTTSYPTTNPQHVSLQAKEKKLLQKAKKNMRKINFKRQ
ncbi:hypothetical protein Tco_0774311 [Tanacetum coccineum]|uniref:Uncharacterized protein n=1 Tax=Tanacetum coccineum TaxID=301880 RepID=A0ABQ4ZRM1_9ASTR